MPEDSPEKCAQRIVASLLNGELARVKVEGSRFTLAIYEDEDSLNILVPENLWSLAYHRSVVHKAQRILESRGGVVQLVPISLASYQAWLGDRDNTSERRAEYVNEQTR